MSVPSLPGCSRCRANCLAAGQRELDRCVSSQNAYGSSDWSAAPVEVLQRAFKLQANTLDNCAAACTCSAWRRSVNSSSIDYLHLHSIGSPSKSWVTFLGSRAYIRELKLSCSPSWHKHVGGFGTTETIKARQNFSLSSLRCKQLHLSEHLARLLPETLYTQSELQRLSMLWTPRMDYSDGGIARMPDMYHMTHLTELHITSSFTDRETFINLGRFPTSLQTLKLTSSGSDRALPEPSETKMPYTLIAILQIQAALTHLELTGCSFTLHRADVTCLRNLESLSLSKCSILADQQLNISQLTKLTELDVTQTYCCAGLELLPALTAFESWPALKLLRLRGAFLVDPTAVKDILGVEELWVDWPGLAAMCSSGAISDNTKVHLESTASFHSQRSAVFRCQADIVSLDVAFEDSDDPCGVFFPFVQACSLLQSLDLRERRDMPSTFELVQSLEGLECLQHVQSLQVCLTDLHFDRLLELTSLTVHDADSQDVLTHFFLPPKLQVLDFSGCCLCDSNTQHNLQDLTALTDLHLYPKPPADMRPAWNPALPAMPTSLRKFTLTGWNSCNRYNAPDWSVLEACSNLEHLSVPADHQEDLQNNITSTSKVQLHVSDNALNPWLRMDSC